MSNNGTFISNGGSNLDNGTVIAATSPNTVGHPRVDLQKGSFDSLIQQKGYDVWHDKAHKCPCVNVLSNHANSSCRNCGGSSWLFTNRTETRMVIQSQSIDTKYKDWSAEKAGSARVTCLNETRLTYMDRIVVRNALMTSSENVHFEKHEDGVWRGYCKFNVKAIDVAYLFTSPSRKLTPLASGDYKIMNGQWIELSPSIVETIDPNDDGVFPTISIRYEHNPEYHIIDITRQVIESYRNTQSRDLNRDKSFKFPLSAVARLAHYVLDQQNFNEEYLFDNDFITCEKKVSLNINNVNIKINSFSQMEIDDIDNEAFLGNIIFNESIGQFQGFNGDKWVPIGLQRQLQETSILASLPSEFMPNTTFANVNLDTTTSGDIDLTDWTPSGLIDGAVLQIKLVRGDNVITFTDQNGILYDHVNQIGEFITIRWDESNNRMIS